MTAGSARWADALTLPERIALLPAGDAGAGSTGVDPRLVRLRLAQWRAEPQFADEEGLTRWLDRAGVSMEQFVGVLGEPPTRLARRAGPPAWWDELQRAYEQPHADDAGVVRSRLKLDWGQPLRGFLHLVAPLLAPARRRLRAEAHGIAREAGGAPFDPDAVDEVLVGTALPELLRMVNRTLVMELNVARVRGGLEGETSQERFAWFVDRLREPATAVALLETYPVLARQLTVRIGYWLEASLEFLRRLCADWEAVRQTFAPDLDPGDLVDVDGQLGDSHRRGRSVLVATFASGLRVVHKPRPLAVDVHFNDVLRWLNDHGTATPFRVLTVLDRGSHGWVEHVDNLPCASRQEVRRFYLRQGGYLALLYALEAMDFHSENVLAAGEHPVMVDLEALLHPALADRDTSGAAQDAGDLLASSVLRVGLLPQRAWVTPDSAGFDFSGIGAADGQLTPFTVPYCEDVGTDLMRVERRPMPMTGYHNRPALPGHDVDLADHAEDIVDGFRGVYDLLLAHRDEVLAAEGPLTAFAGDEVRVILRDTRTYGVLLYESLHPSMLRDGLDRDVLLSRLWVEAAQRAYLADVVECEREELANGDVPIFTTRAGSRDLWTGTGLRLDGFFAESGLDRARRRIRELNLDDRERQVWFIRASMAAGGSGKEGTPRDRYPVPRMAELGGVADRQRLLAAARAAGDRLDALAVRDDAGAAWVGLSLTGPGRWSIAALGSDLYDGTAGIAIFLGYLGAVTGRERDVVLARAAARTLVRQIEQERADLRRIGGFTGWGGTLYTLTHLGVLWSDLTLLDLAEDLVELVMPLVELDEQYDVVAGAAGCIAALACLHQVRPSGRILSAATACGDHLLARASQTDGGPAWHNPVFGERPLTGFSHGSAGIAWALLELATLTGQRRYRQAAQDALAYERHLFDPEQGDWPDLRTWGDRRDAGPITAWCHGASGIGLGRLAMLRHMPDPAIRSEADIAVATTSVRGFGTNHSLCHGDLGNIEVLRFAGQALGAPALQARADAAAAVVLDGIDRQGWVCGIPLAVESPGLMMGLAGIGYGLLRLAEPDLVPPVLLLGGPPGPHEGARAAS